MNNNFGIVTLFGSWYFTLVSITGIHWVPVALSSIASLMAIINYYYQIKKNRTK